MRGGRTRGVKTVSLLVPVGGVAHCVGVLGQDEDQVGVNALSHLHEGHPRGLDLRHVLGQVEGGSEGIEVSAQPRLLIRRYIGNVRLHVDPADTTCEEINKTVGDYLRRAGVRRLDSRTPPPGGVGVMKRTSREAIVNDGVGAINLPNVAA